MQRSNRGRSGHGRLAVVQGAPDDLVVDVGDVAHVGDAPALARSQRCTTSKATIERAWPM
jgi:hypothetical protein